MTPPPQLQSGAIIAYFEENQVPVALPSRQFLEHLKYVLVVVLDKERCSGFWLKVSERI